MPAKVNWRAEERVKRWVFPFSSIHHPALSTCLLIKLARACGLQITTGPHETAGKVQIDRGTVESTRSILRGTLDADRRLLLAALLSSRSVFCSCRTSRAGQVLWQFREPRCCLHKGDSSSRDVTTQLVTGCAGQRDGPGDGPGRWTGNPANKAQHCGPEGRVS